MYSVSTAHLSTMPWRLRNGQYNQLSGLISLERHPNRASHGPPTKSPPPSAFWVAVMSQRTYFRKLRFKAEGLGGPRFLQLQPLELTRRFSAIFDVYPLPSLREQVVFLEDVKQTDKHPFETVTVQKRIL